VSPDDRAPVVIDVPLLELPAVKYLDGIPIGYHPGRVCYVPDGCGGYFLHDPERPDRLSQHL
jgi:hypothetical protein